MEKLSAKLPGSLQFGKDGVSPVVKVEEIADGHLITITDVDGTISFEVPNGKDGKSAYDYAVEAGYTGDSSAFANALVKALTSAVLYTEQNLSEEQKTQARENIGAVASVNGTAPDENGNVQVETGGGGSDIPTLFVDVFNPTLMEWICMEEATATGDVAAFFEAVANNKKVLVIANCDLDGECWTEQHGRLKFYAGAVSVEFSEFVVEINNAGDIYTINVL